jgi:Family of unknown function (DUF5995)
VDGPLGIMDVLTRMRAVCDGCPPGDGIGVFTRVYLRVTELVADQLTGHVFHDPGFLARLDVVFAELFLDAVDRAAAGGPGAVAGAWRPLFEARGRDDLLPLQFVVAGMNAHINRDLAVALAATAAERGLRLVDASPQHQDFRAVDGVLAVALGQVKQGVVTGLLAKADAALGEADDRVASWDIAKAREVAWVSGCTLSALRELPLLARSQVRALDRLVGLAGRGLLVPCR